ncbi:MAG: GAF domain-containing protein [Proteobacteria bacterium]|nr:MAG: GAF domain-containing protein [Pseudomonadota bacterium]
MRDIQDGQPISETSAYDLNNCDREPIHIPGTIQSHGYLFHIRPSDLSILQASANVEKLLSVPIDEIVSSKLDNFLTAESVDRMRRAFTFPQIRESNPISLQFTATDSQYFDGILHYYAGAYILELEKSELDASGFFSFYQIVRQSVAVLQESDSIVEACTSASQQIRKITGFDRVTVYKFDENWNGVVVGEDRTGNMDSLLGQRFPASDIPAQVRAIYRLNWLRLIPDRNFSPSTLVPQLNPLTGCPLDLSMSFLRGVSPIHLEYMKNMQMTASMSVRIIKDDKLWGLLSCHHRNPKFLNYHVRSACEFLAEVFSGQMASIETKEAVAELKSLKAILATLEISLSNSADLSSALGLSDGLLRLTNATGAALVLGGKIYLFGITPTLDHLYKIISQILLLKTDSFHSRALNKDLDLDFDVSDVASGLLALKIPQQADSLILWFRPEIIKTIDWAGNPSKRVEETEGVLRLHPRKSFELWKEVVKGQSTYFSDPEITIAHEFRNVLIAKLLSDSVHALESSNLELDSFAQMVSHDLREPLRGIRIYAQHSIEDDRASLTPATTGRLCEIVELSNDLDGLLMSLYNFSKLGRVELSFETVPVLEIVKQVLNRLRPLLLEQAVDVNVIGTWPELLCDTVRTGEIFQNIILNGIKYNDSNHKSIVLSCSKLYSESSVYKFSVQDNGIGIDELYFQEIFQLFKRLHARDEYKGGTGSGLSMTRRLVEQHRGKIWLESKENVGSTFHFTLQPTENWQLNL